MKDKLRQAMLGVVGLVVLAGGSIGLNYAIGKGPGAPCTDDYRCRGYLVAGAACVDADGQAYCSRSCATNADCPSGWSCATATETVRGMATNRTSNVCFRDNWGACQTDADCGEGWRCNIVAGLPNGSCHPAP